MQLKKSNSANSLLAAALAIPGLVVGTTNAAQAADAPTQAEFKLHFAHYREFQPLAKRMKINTPSFFLLLPADQWALQIYATADTMSGASPLFHNTLSGASGLGVIDKREASDIELTRYFDRGTVSVGAAGSTENDYDSAAVRIKASIDSDDKNRTWNFGVGTSKDIIDSINGVADNERRNVWNASLGFTQVLSPVSLLQIGASYNHGDGYYSDPYKPLDFRPDHRNHRAAEFRYHHFFKDTDAALRLAYNFYDDNWGVQAHSVQTEWEQTLNQRFTLTPSLRFYQQTSADFYFDPPFGNGFVFGLPYSGDTRLSAFAAITAGLQLSAKITSTWTADFQYSFYRQNTNWTLFANGSPDLEHFSARVYELGFTRKF